MRDIGSKTGIVHWLKFNLVGIAGVFVQLILLKLMTGVLGLNYLISTALAVEITVLHNFYWHDQWTWRDRPKQRTSETLLRLLRFNATNGLISIIGNLIFMKIFAGLLHLPLPLANLISIGICALFNFIVADLYVFRSRQLA